MTDPTIGRLAAALETPDESQAAGRGVFLLLMWLSAGIGLLGQMADSATAGRAASAVGALAALAVWLHLVHRVHGWRHDTSPQQVTVMLVGVYLLLIVLLTLDPAYLILLFGVYSLTFGFAVDLRLAAGLSFVVTVIWIGAWLFHELPTSGIITPVLVWGTLVVISQILDRITAQSLDRRELLAEVHETRAQLAEAERQRGVLAERQRVAGEIHDTLAQGFTSIVLLSQAMGAQAGAMSADVLTDKLGLVEQTARDNLAATRRLVQDLQPVELDSGSLIDAVNQVAQKHQASTGTDVQVSATGAIRSLGGTTDVAVLRSIQEALANAAKHADADHITIELTYTTTAIDVCVTDDGAGFDLIAPAAQVAGTVGGRGIGIMTKRAHTLGGTASVDSLIGTGTTVSLSFPAPPPRSPELS